MTTLHELAEQLASVRASGTFMAPPSQQMTTFSLVEGYEVAAQLHRAKLRSGAIQVGAKLGFTNQAIWQMVGLDQPFWSAIYDDTVAAGNQVALRSFVAPRIEPEIVLSFRHDLRRGFATKDIEAAIDWAAPAFEIVQCHYPDWVMSPADAIADAGLHGALLVGDRMDVSSNPSELLASTVVQLRCGSDVVARGIGSNTLGGPVQAIEWLLRLPGIELVPAGSVVTTGSLTAAFAVSSGERWRWESTGSLHMAPLEVSFA